LFVTFFATHVQGLTASAHRGSNPRPSDSQTNPMTTQHWFLSSFSNQILLRENPWEDSNYVDGGWFRTGNQTSIDPNGVMKWYPRSNIWAYYFYLTEFDFSLIEDLEDKRIEGLEEMVTNIHSELQHLRQKISKLNHKMNSKTKVHNEVCIDSTGKFRKSKEIWTVESFTGECAKCICEVRNWKTYKKK